MFLDFEEYEFGDGAAVHMDSHNNHFKIEEQSRTVSSISLRHITPSRII